MEDTFSVIFIAIQLVIVAKFLFSAMNWVQLLAFLSTITVINAVINGFIDE